jgi:HAE1 family hydrophobic/amphiphilic exporter-1
MSLKNRLIVGLATIAIAVFGVVATSMLNQELMPSMTTPNAMVQATLPGASPDVVEETVTDPLETALSSVADVEAVETETTSGAVTATVTWPFEADADEVNDAIASAVESVRADLPENADASVLPMSIDDVPVLQAAVTNGEDEDLAGHLEAMLVPDLEGVPGVRDVEVSGPEERQVSISLDEDAAQDAGVDAQTLTAELEGAGTVVPGGETVDGDRSLAIEVGTPQADLEALEDTPIRAADGTVLLGDIADISLERAESTSLSRANGSDAVMLSVTKEPEANVVAVSHAVADVLEQKQEELGGELEFSTVFDQAPYIEQSIHDLSVEGGLGLFFAVLVILVFLGSFRSTIVAAVSIPLSLLIAMIGLLWGEYTLNILTLGALTIAVGRVVDDSIVVIENIRRRQGEQELDVAAIVASVRQVAGAITASTLTTVAVFLPIAFVSGVTGELFRPFSVTVTLALLASLLVSLTIVPVLSYWFLRYRPRPLKPAKQAALDARWEAWHAKQDAAAEKRRAKAQAKIEKKNRVREKKGKPLLPDAVARGSVVPARTGEASDPVDRLQRTFLPSIQAALRHPWKTIAASALVLVLTGVMATMLKTDFLGDQGENSLYVTQELPAGSSLETSDAAAAQVEEVLGADPDVEAYVANVTAASGGASNSITVTLDEEADPAVAAQRLQAGIDELDGAGEVRVDSAGSVGMSDDIEVTVAGTDDEARAEAADALAQEAEGLDGVAAVSTDEASTQPMLLVDVDRAAAADQGFSQAEVGAAVSAALEGVPAGTVTLEGEERDILIAPTHPDASPGEIEEIELPVTELQTMNAQEEAQDSLTERQEARADEAMREAEADAAEGLEQAREARDAAGDQVEDLRDQLEELRNPSVPPSPEEAMDEQIREMEDAIREAQEGYDDAAQQVDDLVAAQDEAEADRAEEEALADEQEAIPDITGDAITLGSIADVREEQTQTTITRADGERETTVLITPEEGALSIASAGVSQAIEQVDVPDGVTVGLAGAGAEQDESFAQMGFAMLIAIILVLIVMVATFRSLVQPLILLVSVPLAGTGAVILLAITGIPLGLPALIGLLMLIGIVVTNAIVLVDLVNKLRDQGLDLDEAVVHGTRLRLRPILMTAAATIFALLPMAFGITGGGVFISQPLAVVVIGGLTSSTLLTLVLVPVLYTLVESWKLRWAERRSRKRARRAASRGEVAAQGEVVSRGEVASRSDADTTPTQPTGIAPEAP